MDHELFRVAESLDIDITYKKTSFAKSFVLYDENKYTVNISDKKFDSDAERNVCLAHELGHCISGTTYTINHSKLYRGSAEYRADYRASQLLVPIEKLNYCIDNNIIEVHELSEHFNITEEFMRRVLYIYENKGMLQERSYG